MRHHVGVLTNVLTVVVAAMAVGMLITSETPKAAAASSTKKATKPFSVRFRTQLDLPRNKDMRLRKLNRLIGTDYDEKWMSKKPMITADSVNGNRTSSRAPLNRPASLSALPLPEHLPAQYHEMVRSWLALKTTCPVEFVWIDLGELFWPRWIKKGRCGRTTTVSCSWPPGMRCMPTSVRILSILRWHCWLKKKKNKRKNHGHNLNKSVANETIEFVKEHKRASFGKKKKKSKLRCMWIKVPYPVDKDCTCSCNKLSN